jgi:hypothetical protein
VQGKRYLQSKAEGILGEEMPKKKKEEEATPWYIWLLLFVLFILLLKVFRVLPDPIEIELIAGIGASLTVVGCFAFLFSKMFSFENRLSKTETKIETIVKDVTELKVDSKQIRDTLNQIKGKLKIL